MTAGTATTPTEGNHLARSKDLPRSHHERQRRRFQVQLSGPQALLYALGLVAALTWMFVFGVMVGRGVPMAGAGSDSLKGRLAHFLGLDQKPPERVEKASETWKSTEEMLQALSYHNELKGKSIPTEASGSAKTEDAPTQTPAAPPPPVAATEPGSQPPAAGRYVLMVASLRSKDNADSLLAGLKAKGYSPWLEAVPMAEGGLWYRVVLGNFEKRQDAQQFAASFNEKENQQSLVIQVGN